jgi:hypothetical protein
MYILENPSATVSYIVLFRYRIVSPLFIQVILLGGINSKCSDFLINSKRGISMLDSKSR